VHVYWVLDFTVFSRVFHDTDFGMAYDDVVADLEFRPAAHLSMNYFLDTMDRASRWLGRDVVDSMVFLAMVGENFRGHGLTDQAVGGAELEDFAPASITALARTLDMPYETVRRHALALCAAGFCRKQKGGYVVPAQVADHLNLDDLLSDITMATLGLVKDLAQVGLKPPAATAAVLSELSRQSARMAIRYFVQGAGAFCRSLNMDMLRAIILLNIVRRNHTAFEDGLDREVDANALAQWFSDSMRQSVSAYFVAKTMRLPYETVRRHCRALIDQGALEADAKGGLVVTGRQLNTQLGLQAAKSAWVGTRNFMDSLAKLAAQLPGPAFA
jgi:hypothetical protein